jgi:hypothetical protein
MAHVGVAQHDRLQVVLNASVALNFRLPGEGERDEVEGDDLRGLVGDLEAQ